MAANRRRKQQSPIGAGTIFGLIMVAIGLFCLATGFGIIVPFSVS